MANWAHLTFQDPASPIMTQLVMLHDHALLILSMIITLVGFALFFLMAPSPSARYIVEAQTVEIIWTALPAFTLLFLAFPSLHLLYLMDEVSNPAITFKVIGHQWYWSYEYSDFNSISFDSYMTQTSNLSPGEFRLLEVDHRIILPMSMEIRALITSADVIHSWTIPAMGMKVDAVPGRLNQLGFIPVRPGVFYGQCSEICGANHSFMPIAMEIVPLKVFSSWILNNYE